MKRFAMLGFLVLVLSLFSASAFALPNFVQLDAVKVNGVVVNENSPVLLERGEQVVVEVFFRGSPNGRCESGNDNPCYDTRVEAEIQGHEHEEIRDVVGPFEVEPGVSYRKLLYFTLPIDMPASDDLNLNVEIKDDDELVFFSVPVRIQENRHKLNVYDVVFNPTDNVRAGQPLFTTVRVENLGDNTEGSVKVTVAMPELGVQVSEYVDRLASTQDDDEDVDEAATTNDLMLMIPQDAEEGDYDVVVTVEYDRGFSAEQETFSMHVVGVEQAPTVEGTPRTGALVNVQSETLRAEAGEGAVYTLSVANLGTQAATFTFEVSGADSWASVRTDPSVLVVQPDDAKEVFVFVAPREGVEGTKLFSIKTLSNGQVVSESQLMLDVVEPEGATAKRVFTWIFVVLLVLLLLLLITVLVKKATSKEKGVENQTYY